MYSKLREIRLVEKHSSGIKRIELLTNAVVKQLDEVVRLETDLNECGIKVDYNNKKEDPKYEKRI